MSNKPGIVINRMYVGEYLSSNLGHEIINLFQADNGCHYLYLNSSGSLAKEHESIDKMLLVRYENDDILEVIGMAKGLHLAPDVTVPRSIHLNEKDERIWANQRSYIEQEDIRYGTVSILDIFSEAEQQTVFITYKADEVRVPKDNIRIFLNYGEKAVIREPNNYKIKIVKLLHHKLPKTSLKSYIYQNNDSPNKDLDYENILTEIIENNSLWSDNPIDKVEIGNPTTHTPVSIFDICQIQNDENRFSCAFAYFMNHPQYHHLWKAFFQKKGIVLDDKYIVRREVEALIPAAKEKTGGRIDLFIEDDNNIIVIENKIKSDINTKPSDKIGESQLNRYKEFINFYDKDHKKNHWFFILAPDYNNPHISSEMAGIYTILRYSEVYNFIGLPEFKKIVEDDPNFTAFKNVMFRHTLTNPNGYLYYEMLEKFLNRISEIRDKEKDKSKTINLLKEERKIKEENKNNQTKDNLLLKKNHMAKKSAISGEYIITQEDNGTIRVCKIFDNVKGSLREAAKSIGFEFDPNWTTQQFGNKIVKSYGDGKMAEVDEYTIVKRDSGAIETYRTYANTKEALREIAASIGFTLDPNWTTRQCGSKLIDVINS